MNVISDEYLEVFYDLIKKKVYMYILNILWHSGVLLVRYQYLLYLVVRDTIPFSIN